MNAVLGWLFRGFNRLFDQMTEVYGRVVGGVLRISAIVLLLYAGLLVLTYWQFNHAPDGIHSAAGQGISAAQRAVARFGLGRAYAAGHGPYRIVGSQHAGR